MAGSRARSLRQTRAGRLPISSMVRPVSTLSGRSSVTAPSPGRAASSASLRSSHCGLPPSPAGAHQQPAPVQLLAVERELQLAAPQRLGGVAFGFPSAAVPQQHRAAAVLPLGDDAFEVAVVDGVVLDLDGEPLVGGVERRPLGHRPALEHAVVLEAEVVVEAPRGVLLDDEAPRRRRLLARLLTGTAARLRRLLEVALPVVLRQAHRAQAGRNKRAAAAQRARAGMASTWPGRSRVDATLLARRMAWTEVPWRRAIDQRLSPRRTL